MSTLWSPDLYRRAYRFAAEAHHGQAVPGTALPYLLHVGLVCMEVTAALAHEPGHAGDLAVQCALLHDVLEDTPITFEQLSSTFGLEVAYGVEALSKNTALPAPQQMADSLARIQQRPRAVWMVKLADRITNLQPPPASWSRDKCARYRDEARAIAAALAGASPYLERRLEQHIAQYAVYCVEA